MALQNATIVDGATIAVSGGTSKTYGPTGTKIANGLQIADQSVANKSVQPFYNLAAKPPSYDKATDSWGMDKRVINSVIPYVDAKLKQQFPGIETKVNFTQDMTAAQKNALVNMHVQALIDGDFTNFVQTGSLL